MKITLSSLQNTHIKPQQQQHRNTTKLATSTFLMPSTSDNISNTPSTSSKKKSETTDISQPKTSSTEGSAIKARNSTAETLNQGQNRKRKGRSDEEEEEEEEKDTQEEDESKSESELELCQSAQISPKTISASLPGNMAKNESGSGRQGGKTGTDGSKEKDMEGAEKSKTKPTGEIWGWEKDAQGQCQGENLTDAGTRERRGAISSQGGQKGG
ncbi:hypothetical protein BJX99DRAFT_131513 [Aspergillus californicus]